MILILIFQENSNEIINFLKENRENSVIFGKKTGKNSVIFAQTQVLRESNCESDM